ncbi:MAG: bile acid:sodium symporter [Candidatus Protistobacter heckmanni]|nr:bile acid:sodium symporter [Candidatus Protistobacter heckmanni]
MRRPRFLPENFTLMLIATVTLASLLPCHGEGARFFDILTDVCVGGMFFFHGAKLSRDAVVSGLTSWRLHLLVMLATFAVFPILGLALRPVLQPLVGPQLYLGVLFICALPSTVQSSVVFTSMARGNVPAAVCSASASNILGMFITPVLVGLMVATHGDAGASPSDSIGAILMQLLLPFIAGQIARRWIGGWVERRKSVLKAFDQGSILLVVYTAFSEAVIEHLWNQVSLRDLGGILVVNAVLLAIVMLGLIFVSRRLDFSREDEIAIVFCGSKKTLASGVPMAKVLFAGSLVMGAIVLPLMLFHLLPLMLFHQMQLMACAVLAQRYARRPEAGASTGSKAASPGVLQRLSEGAK